jgi:hypothetical protein
MNSKKISVTNKIVFNKRTIVKLTEDQLTSINGGTGCWTKFGNLTEALK